MMSSRARLTMVGVVLASACFDGEGLRGAPCLSDADCGPKLSCLGPEGAGVCGGGDANPTQTRWPDSPTVYCTDGRIELETCPEPGFAGYGQDGNYRIAVPSYEESDGIVHDSITGLDWESSSTFDAYTQADALDRCANLQHQGRSWRLPSRLELASLLDYGRDIPFPDLHMGAHWTASGAGGANEFWAIDFVSWSTVVFDGSYEAFVVCVSGEPLVSSFSMTEATVRDNLTGLEWLREPHDQILPWTEALAHCEGLEAAGHSDWRLPSAKELLTLGRDDREPVAGIEDDGDIYWTSSPNWPTDRAVTMRMPDGLTGADTTDLVSNHVRCVRSLN